MSLALVLSISVCPNIKAADNNDRLTALFATFMCVGFFFCQNAITISNFPMKFSDIGFLGNH